MSATVILWALCAALFSSFAIVGLTRPRRAISVRTVLFAPGYADVRAGERELLERAAVPAAALQEPLTQHRPSVEAATDIASAPPQMADAKPPAWYSLRRWFPARTPAVASQDNGLQHDLEVPARSEEELRVPSAQRALQREEHPSEPVAADALPETPVLVEAVARPEPERTEPVHVAPSEPAPPTPSRAVIPSEFLDELDPLPGEGVADTPPRQPRRGLATIVNWFTRSRSRTARSDEAADSDTPALRAADETPMIDEPVLTAEPYLAFDMEHESSAEAQHQAIDMHPHRVSAHADQPVQDDEMYDNDIAARFALAQPPLESAQPLEDDDEAINALGLSRKQREEISKKVANEARTSTRPARAPRETEPPPADSIELDVDATLTAAAARYEAELARSRWAMDITGATEPLPLERRRMLLDFYADMPGQETLMARIEREDDELAAYVGSLLRSSVA